MGEGVRALIECPKTKFENIPLRKGRVTYPLLSPTYMLGINVI